MAAAQLRCPLRNTQLTGTTRRMCYSILSCSSSSRHYRPCALQQAAPHRQLGPFRLPLLVDHIPCRLPCAAHSTVAGVWCSPHMLVLQERVRSCSCHLHSDRALCLAGIVMEPFALHHHGTICTACTAVAVTKRQVTECHVMLVMSLCPTLGKLHCTAPTQPF
jgi:hypothetical protein